MFGNELDLIIPLVCFLIFLIGVALHHERIRNPRSRELLAIYDQERDTA